METELSSGIRLGLMSAIAVVAITTALLIFSSGKALDAHGLSQMEKVQVQNFYAYNDTIVSGADVKSVACSLSETDTGVIVTLKNGTAPGYCFGAVINTGAGVTVESTPLTGSEYQINTLPAQTARGCEAAYFLSGSEVVHNKNVKPLAHKIDVTGQFKSQLIFDATGSIIGIYFNQI